MRVRLNGWRLPSEEHIENAFTLTLILKVARWRPSVDSRKRNKSSRTFGALKVSSLDSEFPPDHWLSWTCVAGL
jgi:hypothetical protein